MVRQIMTLVISLGFIITAATYADGSGRAPASLAPSLTFAEYAAENASHPALSRKIADHQTAFVDIYRASVISPPVNEIKETDTPLNAQSPQQATPQGTTTGTTPSGDAGLAR